MKDIRAELVKLLRNIYNDHDFVCGTLSNCDCESAWRKMYDFIRTAKRRGDDLSSDDILLLSLIFGEESNAEKDKKQRVAAL